MVHIYLKSAFKTFLIKNIVKCSYCVIHYYTTRWRKRIAKNHILSSHFKM